MQLEIGQNPAALPKYSYYGCQLYLAPLCQEDDPDKPQLYVELWTIFGYVREDDAPAIYEPAASWRTGTGAVVAVTGLSPCQNCRVIPFNLVSSAAGNPYDIAAAIQEAFRRTWPGSLREAPHFSNVVTAALIVLIVNDLTLMQMARLLTNADFREQCLQHVSDQNVVESFHGRCDPWGREAPLMRERTKKAPSNRSELYIRYESDRRTAREWNLEDACKGRKVWYR